MRRPLVALVLAAALGPSALASEQASASWRSESCRLSHGDGWSRREILRTIRCAARRWPPPGGASKAIDVASCESGLDPGAYSSGNAGLFQQRLVYWPGRRRSFNSAVARRYRVRPSAYNARSNTLVSVRMAHLYGWGAWSCA